MNDFSVLKAATAGFRLFLNRPALTVTLALLTIVTGFGISAMGVGVAGSELSEWAAMGAAQRSGAGGQPDPQAMFAILGPIINFLALVLLVVLAYLAIAAGAIHRAMLRPKDSRPPFIGFTGDELRLTVVNVVLGLIVGLPSFILYIIAAIVSSLVAVSLAGRGALQAMAAGGAPPQGLVIAGLTAMAIGVVGALFWSVKFSIAHPQTVAERGIRIFGSWELTKGHYWKVLATLLLSLVLVVIIGLVNWGVIYGVALGLGEDPKTLMQPDLTEMSALWTPLALIRTAVGAVLNTLSMMILFAAGGASMYRGLAEGNDAPATVADDDEDWDDE